MGTEKSPKSRNETSFQGAESAKLELLRAAKKLFARRGLSGTTIRDIALEAGTNSSQISYYFEGKEGLYRACIENIAQNELGFAEQILTPAQSKEEFKVRLRLFADTLINHFLKDHDAGLMIVREFDRAHSPAEREFRSSFLKVLNLIEDFFSLAAEQAYIDQQRDPHILTSLFLGAIMNELRIDHLKQDVFKRSIRDKNERIRIVDHIVCLFTA